MDNAAAPASHTRYLITRDVVLDNDRDAFFVPTLEEARNIADTRNSVRAEPPARVYRAVTTYEEVTEQGAA